MYHHGMVTGTVGTTVNCNAQAAVPSQRHIARGLSAKSVSEAPKRSNLGSLGLVCNDYTLMLHSRYANAFVAFEDMKTVPNEGGGIKNGGGDKGGNVKRRASLRDH